MNGMDRREFVKSVSLALGTAAFSCSGPLLGMARAQEKPKAAKPAGTGIIYEVYAIKYFAGLNY